MTAVTGETLELLTSPEHQAGYWEQYFRLGQLAATAAAKAGIDEAIAALEEGARPEWVEAMRKSRYVHDGLLAFGLRTGWNSFEAPDGLAHRIISGNGSRIQPVKLVVYDGNETEERNEILAFAGTAFKVPYGQTNELLSRELRVLDSQIYALPMEGDVGQAVRSTDTVELVDIRGDYERVVMHGGIMIGAWMAEDEFTPWEVD